MDRRLLRSNGRVAHAALQGKVEAETFAAGNWMQAALPIVPLCASPGGAMDLQLVFGQRFCVLEVRDGHAFGFTAHDGYCGYVPSTALGPPAEATHRIAVPQSYGKPTADLKKTEPIVQFYMNAEVVVAKQASDWSAMTWADASGADHALWLPSVHLAPVGEVASDPVAVAEMFLHAPYLWGGNTAAGIDCSALVQAGYLAAGLPCPRDSDLQCTALGKELAPDARLQRSDLIFWKGHVGLMMDAERLLHANAHHMAVAIEPLFVASARIEANGDGPITARKRP
ncbi:MAG: C40 family peptidase [Alphaproteobacteria bacterium]|nr:C40 family peptidase [Alphaproteobacteria bacterium]